MSLFPAYASDSSKAVEGENEPYLLAAYAAAARPPDSPNDVEEITSGSEGALLASDADEPPAAAPAPAARLEDAAPFYRDTRLDGGNLRVSTLYYPGRPEYHARGEALALGGGARARACRRAARRYWQARPEDAAGGTRAAAAEAAAALRRALAAQPGDEALWLRYVAFQEEWGSGGAALDALREATAALGAGPAALQRARARLLPPEGTLEALRAALGGEARAGRRAELCARLAEAAGAARAEAAARAALGALGGGAAGAGYARVLYAHGCVLRAAGLWERLVLTVELAAAMNFPPARAFPPPPDAAAERRREERAAAREDEACRSGLPLGAVWARVERLRGAAHWRPARGAALEADPQRAPAPAAVADLLRGVRGERAAAALCVALLRLARVPLLPAAERAARAAGPEPRAGEPAAPEALAALLRAARRLPRAHPARPAAPAAARAALAPLLDPPHYFSDEAGYLTWTGALWEACCGWTAGARRLALVCWRLRWLHALALLAEPAEARRLRLEARAALKRHAPDEPLAFAHFARLEAEAGGAEAGRRAARRALRAALAAGGAEPERALFAARVVGELDGAAPARWALCCAALGRAPPPDAALETEPPRALRDEALLRAAERCAELELGFASAPNDGEDEEEEEEEECAAMLPGVGEWAAARVALSPPEERARLLAAALVAPRAGGAALQYREQAACALVLGAAGGARRAAARALLPLFPRNALLALVCSGAAAWAGGAAYGAACGAAEGERGALALVVPLLLRAPLAADAEPADAARLARACGAASRRGGGSALLAALRLEAEARAPTHGTQRALLAALADYPDHKWLYVRGATWCGAEADAMPDALLERGLRLHALPDELRAPPA